MQTMRFDAVKIEKKLKMAAGLFEMIMTVKKNQIRTKFPHLTNKEIHLRAYALIEKSKSR